METKFLRVSLQDIPKDDNGRSRIDLYVHLPTAQKYVRYVLAGDEIDAQKLEAIKHHTEPDFYKLESDQPLVDTAAPKVETRTIEEATDFNPEILGNSLKQEIKDVYKYIIGDAADPGVAVKRFEGMSDKLVNFIAPDIKSLSEHLKKQSKYLSLMSDSAAISTIAILCAFANGFDSRKSYRELSYATLVMDISLVDFSDEQINTYYVNRDALPKDVLKEILFHPMRSYQLAEQKLKSFSDVTMQLILTHHELYNGKGFPRGIRTEALFPIARVLSLAVDIFENLKASDLRGEKKSLLDILNGINEQHSEAHMRRHNKKLIDGTLTFLMTDNAQAPAKPTI
ncbi:MAG: hypothetical protein JST16_13380 [Bdellovibrionales bacterium]|nr:hypothetical protein [Bdellovibrionales bacterium]